SIDTTGAAPEGFAKIPEPASRPSASATQFVTRSMNLSASADRTRMSYHSPRGYALPWIILTVAIIAALAAVGAPALTTLDDRTRALNSATQLKLIANGFVQFGAALNQYPGRVSQLTTPITTSTKNTCGQTMSAADVTQWTANAPFAPIYTATNG